MILAAVAVALAASRYLRRHLDTAAMLRCFGASRRRALALFVLQFAALGIVASVAGIALALAGQSLLVALLASVAPTELPPPSVLPARHGFRHRCPVAVRLRVAAADRARERAAAARAAARPAPAASGRDLRLSCWARASSRC